MSRSTSSPVRIVVDVHEKKSGLPTLLEELGAQIEVAPPDADDYAVSDDTIVERKRVRPSTRP